MRANIYELETRRNGPQFTPDMAAAQFMGDQAVARANTTAPASETPKIALNQPQTGEYRITLPRFGVKVIAPEHTARVMALAQKHKAEGTRFTQGEKANLWPVEEKVRLAIMKNCAILAKRYPTREAGERYMQDVDFARREELLAQAGQLTAHIVEKWREINPSEDIAVLLFGSVAKGLVKRPDHPDPSNIDLAVIGHISDEQRDQLLTSIRPERDRLREEILAKVPRLDSQERNPGNAGVMVQDLSKLTNGEYYGARNYIASGTIPLYDPEGMWRQVEREALAFSLQTITKPVKGHKQTRFGIPVLAIKPQY